MLGDLNFSPLCMFISDHKNATSINLGLQIHFNEKVNLQIWNESMNNKDQLYLIELKIFFTLWGSIPPFLQGPERQVKQMYNRDHHLCILQVRNNSTTLLIHMIQYCLFYLLSWCWWILRSESELRSRNWEIDLDFLLGWFLSFFYNSTLAFYGL